MSSANETTGASTDGASSARMSCGRKRQTLDAKKIPPEVRLNFHREVPTDRIRSSIPKPEGYLPPTYLPAWPEIPLDVKLPNLTLPKAAIFYARGILGQPIYHKPKYFSTYDPNNQERIIKEEYNSLHDPHAKRYLLKPGVRKHLIRQGLITKDCQVLCTPKEFNIYRTYLNTLYHDDIENSINNEHLRDVVYRQSDIELKQYFEKSDGNAFHKIENARKRQRKIYEERVQKIEERQQTAIDRDEKWRQEEWQRRYEKQILAYNIGEAQKLRLAAHKQGLQDKQAKAYMYQINKEQLVTQRIELDKQLIAEARRQFLLKWMDSKWDFQEERMKRDHLVKDSIQSDFIDRARRRQKRIEHHREILPQIIQRQRRDRERVWNLVKKFFYRWLNKVRTRKAKKPDDNHLSLWNVTENFDDTVKYLHKESGYEKLDDLIMGILKLKRNIKAELEREAAEEALSEREEEEEDEEGVKEVKSKGKMMKEEDGEEEPPKLEPKKSKMLETTQPSTTLQPQPSTTLEPANSQSSANKE